MKIKKEKKVQIILLLLMLTNWSLAIGQTPLYRHQQDGKWGFVNNKNEVVIEHQYQAVGNFYETIAAVKSGEKWGFINTKNEVISPFEYDFLQFFAAVKVYKVEKNKLFGVLDIHAKPLTLLDLSDIGNIYRSKAVVRKGEQYGLLEMSTGNYVLEVKYDSVVYDGSDRVRVKKKKNWGCLTDEGKPAISFKYEEIDRFYGNRAKAKRKGKWGFVDKKGKKVLDFKFDFVGDFVYNDYLEDLYAPYVFGKRMGLVSTWGSAVPFEYQEVAAEYKRVDKDLTWVRLDKTYGAVNNDGEVVIPFLYQNPIVWSEGWAAVKKQGKFGYINKAGQVVFPFELEAAAGFEGGKAAVVKDGKKGFLNKDGIIEF